MSDAVLEALWKKVLDAWDDEAAHGAFIEHCRATDRLLEAAVRYRGMAGDHVRGAAADKRLKAIALLAVASLETERSTPARNHSGAVSVVLILFFLGGSLWLFFAMK
ncbi:MAG TPA: hypothetical protein VHE30_21960 [Polyangiaceae bacterium]|nr:hypothetical protein [Polyangiaceae bacterium]